MKKLILAASVTLLAACSTPQHQQISFNPTAELSSSDIVENRKFTLVSKDVRSAQYVALVDSGHNNIEPVHARQNVRIALENALASQFESQGFTITVNSENTLILEIQEALVTVTHSLMENEMSSKVLLQLTAETPRGKLTKSYTGTAKRTSAFSASSDEIEQVLNDVVNLVLKDIANDPELQKYMKERFNG